MQVSGMMDCLFEATADPCLAIIVSHVQRWAVGNLYMASYDVQSSHLGFLC